VGVDAAAYASHPGADTSWVRLGVKNEEFLRELFGRVGEYRNASRPEAGQSRYETYGVASDIHDWIRGKLHTLADRARWLLSNAAVRYGRRHLHEKAALFLGDVITYFASRGSPERPGKIVEEVLAGLLRGENLLQAKGGPLIVLAHSMGGNIVYDILTHFAPGRLQVPVDLVTVGSQVGLIKELGFFEGRDPNGLPQGLRSWVNVYDPLDVLAFLAAPTCEGAVDLPYSNNTGLLSAHTAYFHQPGFFLKVGRQLAVAPPSSVK
jgi:hypothetical protein